MRFFLTTRSPLPTPTRAQFIELHGEPMLQHLYESFKKDYPEVADEFRPPPETGTLDLLKVRESVYFFS